MPKIGAGRIEPGTGDVSFNRAEPAVPGLTPRAASTFVDVRSVTGTNLGFGAGLFAGTNGTNDIVLDFKGLVAGSGIALAVNATSVIITALAGPGGAPPPPPASFVDLTDGPGAIAPRGLVVGNAAGNGLVFVAPPDAPDTTLTWTGSAFRWAVPQQGGVRSVALIAAPPLAATGSPITDSGTLFLSLAESGVAPGDYNRVTVDVFGRVTGGQSISYLTGEADSLQSVMERGANSDRDMVLSSPTSATTPNSGALVVAGGAGIGGALFVGGDLTVLGALNANITGSADAARRLAEPRAIALDGVVTGRGVFDGSADLVIATELAPTGVVPGTYGRVEVGADGRVLFGGALVQEDIKALLASLTLGDLTVAGNLVVGGDASVTGNFTTVNTSNLTVDDTYILLGGGVPLAADDGRDRGVAFRWHDGTAPQIGFFGFRSASGRLTFRTTVDETALTTGIFAGDLGQIEANITGTAERAERLSAPRTLALVGAVTGAVTTDFGQGVTLTAALAAPGAAVGTFSRVLVDASGRVVSGSNPAPQNAPITLTGDASGTGSTAIAVSLASVITPGTFARVTVDAKGRVVAGGPLTNADVVAALGFTPAGGALPITLGGDATGSGTTGTVPVSLVLASSGVTPGTYNRVSVDAKGRVVSGVNAPVGGTIALTGDATGSGSLDGSIVVVLASSGVTPGTYDRVVVDAKGRVTTGSNPPAPGGSIALAGDVSGTGTLNGSIVVTLATTGVTPGTYGRVVVDSRGRVLSGAAGGSTDTLADVTARGATTATPLALASANIVSATITGSAESTTSSTGALRITGGLGVGGNLNTGATSATNLGIGSGSPLGARLWVHGNHGASISPLAWNSSLNLNLGTANSFAVTLGGTTSFGAPTGALPGQSGVVFLAQDGSGNRIASFSAAWRFPNGTAPSLSAAANAVDALVYVVRAANVITAVLIPNV